MKAAAQRGVALLTAVMVVAFASTLTTGLMVSQNLAVHRASNMRGLDTAWWYLIGLEEWAGTILRRDAEDSQIDELGEVWAQRIDFLPVDEGVLAGQIIDLNSRFNLNSLHGAQAQEAKEQFLRLLRAIPELSDQPVENLASSISDWIDEDSQPLFPGGAEDEIYLARETPYRAANQPLVSVTELRLVEGISAEIYRALVPHVAAWPRPGNINVNTATGPVLQSLAEGISPAEVEALLLQREEEPWNDKADFLTHEALAGRQVVGHLDVKSNFFLAEAAAEIDGVRLELRSIMERGADGRARVLLHSRAPL